MAPKDSFTALINANASTTYNFSNTGIAWPGEAKKYVSKPTAYNVDDIVPPPNWVKLYPNYNSSGVFPDLYADEHFQNWMRTSGLPTFSKLWGRNDNQPLPQGTYYITINLSKLPHIWFRMYILSPLDFPVRPYKGTKSIIISTVSWIGGKNPFLGWAYVAAAAVFIVLAIAGTARHLIKPRSVSFSDSYKQNIY